MTERDEALKLANRLLDEPNADPDDDLRMLSRQLLRSEERETSLAAVVECFKANRPHPTHQWNRSILTQCVRCAAFASAVDGKMSCDPSRIEGRVELCCECGKGYPVSDLIAGHIYCPKCRETIRPTNPAQEETP